MAKRTTKRASRRGYDEDDFNEDELKEELEDDDEEFQDDYDSDDYDEEEEEEERPVRRPSRKKAASKKHASVQTPNKEVRLKAFWAVYSVDCKRVDVFDYSDKKKAEARAAELTESKKMFHFVKMDKKVIES
ncbi:MAG: hypothetical protein IJU53_05540 [Thermoguttaceae bacterium]|nr:hypothetical protein [Thermoguttaceae bacterium]